MVIIIGKELYKCLLCSLMRGEMAWVCSKLYNVGYTCKIALSYFIFYILDCASWVMEVGERDDSAMRSQTLLLKLEKAGVREQISLSIFGHTESFSSEGSILDFFQDAFSYSLCFVDFLNQMISTSNRFFSRRARSNIKSIM